MGNLEEHVAFSGVHVRFVLNATLTMRLAYLTNSKGSPWISDFSRMARAHADRIDKFKPLRQLKPCFYIGRCPTLLLSAGLGGANDKL